jgi:hypothetical protein
LPAPDLEGEFPSALSPPSGYTSKLRLTREMVESLEDWRARQRPVPTRQEAIREVLAYAVRQALSTD